MYIKHVERTLNSNQPMSVRLPTRELVAFTIRFAFFK